MDSLQSEILTESQTPVKVLRPHHLADLRHSGISENVAREHGIHSVTREEAAAALGFDPGADCLAIPFPSPNGGKTFIRFKPDAPLVMSDGRAAKYLTPKGAGNRLYIPNGVGEVFSNPAVPLIVTEGEKKSIAATAAGFSTIGLVGVWGWLQRPRDAEGRTVDDAPSDPIPDLDLIRWRGRTVFLCFDSDMTEKREVRRALWALRCELARRGAEVRVVSLPGGEDGAKVGLDDYLVAHGADALRRLLDDAPVLDWAGRAAEILDLTEKDDARDDLLRELIRDLRDADPLTRERVRKALVDGGVLAARTFDAQLRFYAGGDTGAAGDAEGELHEVMTARLPGLVDLVLTPDGVAFLMKDAEGLRVVSHVDADGVRYVPPPREKIPFPLVDAGEVLRHLDEGDAALFDDLIAYHRNISDLPDAWYLLVAVWDCHTWLMEGVNYSPAMVFYAVAERGKTRTTRGMIYVAYRGIVTESLRESYIARFTDAFGGAVCFDVMDLWRKAERAGAEDVILQRFERGATVPRVNRPEAGAFLDTDYYAVFGPTVIATNEPIHHILDTRALTLTMRETTRAFPNDVTPAEAMPLRARLTAFRARHLGQPLPDAEKPTAGRLGDITRPLVQMMRLVRPEREGDLLALIRQLDCERRAEKAETIDGQIVAALLDCAGDVMPDGRLKVKLVTERVNEGRPAGKELTPHYIGRRLRSLGFQRGAGRSDARTIIYDTDLVDRIADKYGVTLCTRAHDAHTVIETSQMSQMSRQPPCEPSDATSRDICDICDVLGTTHTPPARAHISSAETSAVDDLWDEILDEEGHDG